MDYSSLILIFCALFFLFYPQWEEDRARRRREEREAESTRIDIYLRSGIDIRDLDTDDMGEWLHWQMHGRGEPY